MTSRRSSRGRLEHAMAARAQARAALGRRPAECDPFEGPPKKKTPLPEPSGPVWVTSGPSETGLFLGEAATRLGVSRPQLEAMIAAGKVETRPAGLTHMIPSSEIRRLRAQT